MSAKKIESVVEETESKEVNNVEEAAVEKTVAPETTKTEEIAKEEPIVEDEVIIDEKDVIPEEEAKKIEPEDVKEVKAQKVNIEKGNTTKVSLKVLIAFTDKYTKKDYEVNDVLKVDKARAEELLSDARGLVSKV
jgi:hypothetical protein